MTAMSKPTLSSEVACRAFAGRVMFGRSPAVTQLREEVLDFCASPAARNLLIEGPIGAGKSTIARAVAALKRASPLRADMAEDVLGSLKFSGPNLVNVMSMPWYVEQPLTGLTETLAELQLFGSVPGAFTGAVDRAGVFEQAMHGGRKRGESPPEAAQMTGGVTFLDEIGDLAPAHQAKLLPVLSGGSFYRLGAEGRSKDALIYEGTVIAATWKSIDAGLIRADLLSRLSANRVSVPDLDQRMDDFEEIVDSVVEAARKRNDDAIERILRVEKYADRDFWLARRDNPPALSVSDRKQLAQVSWARHGNLRGLAAAVDLVLDRGMDAADAVAALSDLPRDDAAADPVDWVIASLLDREANGDGLAGHVSAVELQLRLSVVAVLRSDGAQRAALAARLGIPAASLATQINQLARSRRRAP